MIECQVFADLAKASQLGGMSFILCGDFLQFSAICQHWAGCSVPEDALEHSDMLRELTGGNRLVLMENKRSDQILYDLYTSLSTRSLADSVREGRILFPKTESEPDITLVISHARRRFLCCKRNIKGKSRRCCLPSGSADGRENWDGTTKYVSLARTKSGRSGRSREKRSVRKNRNGFRRWRCDIGTWSDPALSPTSSLLLPPCSDPAKIGERHACRMTKNESK